MIFLHLMISQQLLSSSLYYVIDVTLLCYRVTPTSLFKAFP